MSEAEDLSWRHNYFNYFTEVEEHFQRARGTSLFLLSPLDWALLEAWKNSGVPLEAVLRGIDAAFGKWHARKRKTQMVNSIAFCAQAVMTEAQAMANNLPSPGALEPAEAPFPEETVRKHLQDCAAALRARPLFAGMAATVEELLHNLPSFFPGLEELDQRLTALEEKVGAAARLDTSDEELFQMRQKLDAQLRPYRGKMSADQLARLEKSYLDRMLFERHKLPRLSLFYMAS